MTCSISVSLKGIDCRQSELRVSSARPQEWLFWAFPSAAIVVESNDCSFSFGSRFGHLEQSALVVDMLIIVDRLDSVRQLAVASRLVILGVARCPTTMVHLVDGQRPYAGNPSPDGMSLSHEGRFQSPQASPALSGPSSTSRPSRLFNSFNWRSENSPAYSRSGGPFSGASRK